MSSLVLLPMAITLSPIASDDSLISVPDLEKTVLLDIPS